MGICGDLLKTHGHRISSNMMRFDGWYTIIYMHFGVVRVHNTCCIIYTPTRVFLSRGKPFQTPKKINGGIFFFIPLPEWAEGCQEICSKKFNFLNFGIQIFNRLKMKRTSKTLSSGYSKLLNPGLIIWHEWEQICIYIG